MNLGRLGVWYPADRLDAAQLRDFAVKVENHGYGALWYPEGRGYESLTLGGYLLSLSSRLVIGSSIANIYARDAFTAGRGLVSLNALYGGRFVLGVGVSHVPLVEGVRGHTYAKPVPAMRAYLEGIRKAQDGADWPVVVAALGPKMLALSAEMAHGAVPYNVTPAHTKIAAGVLGKAKWLAVEQKVLIGGDPTRSRALARKDLALYLGLENYRNNWLRLGFSEEDLAGGGSDRLIDAMVLQGGAETVKKGLRAHFEAGATHVAIQPVHAEGDFAARDQMLEALADT